MAQQLRILQSLWAMERRLANEAEWPLQTQLSMIRDAGFDGAGVRFIDPAFATEVSSFLRDQVQHPRKQVEAAGDVASRVEELTLGTCGIVQVRGRRERHRCRIL